MAVNSGGAFLTMETVKPAPVPSPVKRPKECLSFDPGAFKSQLVRNESSVNKGKMETVFSSGKIGFLSPSVLCTGLSLCHC